MSIRYTDYWENYISPYEDALSDNLDVDDLIIKANFRFKNNYAFSGKTVLNKGENIPLSVAESDYNLDIKFSPLTNCSMNLDHTGKLESEEEINLWSDKNLEHHIGLFGNSTYENRVVNQNIQLLYNYRNNYLFNFGIKDWEINLTGKKCPTRIPTILTLGAISKFVDRDDLRTWGGVHTTFNRNFLAFSNLRFLLGWANDMVNGVLHLDLDRYTKNKYHEKIRLATAFRVHEFFHVFTDLSIKLLEEKTADLTIGTEYVILPETIIKTKVSTDFTATASITHRYRSHFDFTFATGLSLSKSKTNISTGKVDLAHVKSKFGLKFEMIDEHLL